MKRTRTDCLASLRTGLPLAPGATVRRGGGGWTVGRVELGGHAGGERVGVGGHCVALKFVCCASGSTAHGLRSFTYVRRLRRQSLLRLDRAIFLSPHLSVPIERPLSCPLF